MSALWWPNSQPASMRTRSPSSTARSEEHTSELQSPCNLVCRLLLEKKILLGQAEPLREAPDMRVDDDSLRVAQLGRNDVRGLAGHAGQADELLEPAGHAAVALLDQHRHGRAQRPRLLPVEAGRVD